MGQERWYIVIISGFSGRIGVLAGEIRRVELVELGEEHPGGVNLFDICPDFLVRLLMLVYFCLKLLVFFQSYRQVFARLGVIRVGVDCARTGCRRDITITVGGKFGLLTKNIRWSCAV